MTGIEIRIKGKVQGVGFRPLVWQLATELGAKGEVLNDAKGVLVRFTDSGLTDAFKQRLYAHAPPLSRIDSVNSRPYRWSKAPSGFSITRSNKEQLVDTFVVPDAATCPQCLSELTNPANRRYHHPFINCTHCGPRFTIVKTLPYDRDSTVMSAFPMCPECISEYRQPSDRRYHAQPIACPDCGPNVWISDAHGHRLEGDWLGLATEALQQGQILAIKSLGGFHLACDAENASAVSRLRQRKRRQSKPFAVMVPDIGAAQQLAMCSTAELQVLQSSAAPIVLIKQRVEKPLKEIAPGLNEIGLMLPSNPIQHLLLQKLNRPLVMTSGNLTGLPPAINNQDALSELNQIADLFLLHDRPIMQRCDDSLVRVRQDVGGDADPLEFLRRSRGYVPDAIALPEGFPSAQSLLAYGGDLKAAFAIGKGQQVIVSQYLGDLDGIETQRQYRQAQSHFLALYAFRPDKHIADKHPGYFSRQLAEADSQQTDAELLTVQHHHAHIAACLVENDWQPKQGKVLALALDGLGMGVSPQGEDQLWGGELLLADYVECCQVGGIPEIPLPGGDLAAKQPWRALLAHLHTFAPEQTFEELVAQFPGKPIQLMLNAMVRGINSPPARSTGRLFDAVAASLGIAFDEIEYEGQAACQLQALAERAEFPLTEQLEIPVDDVSNHLELGEFWRQWRQLKGVPEQQAYLFHRALANALARMVLKGARQYQIDTLVLTGGVFHNRLLTKLLKQALDPSICVLEHRLFSCGDGGLALGQIAIGVMLEDGNI